MSFLTVRHSTVYRYREPVGLGEHRMMFRPRESHDLRLIRTNLVITPQPAHLRWLHDPFDNSVAVATFEGTTSELRFESTVTLEHFETSMPEYPLEEYARTYPFRYSDEDFPNLARALAHHYPGESVSKWALQFLDPSDTTGTMKILRAMTHGIREQFIYTRRIEKGVQTPEETLRNRRGQLPGFRGPDDGSCQVAGYRGAVCQRLYLRAQPFRPRRRRSHTCLDAGLSARRRLDRLRPHQQHHRQP